MDITNKLNPFPLRVIHYTVKKDWKLKPIKITNPWKGDGIPIKPIGGIWCSPVDSKYGWIDWCKAENWGNSESDCKILLDIDISNFVIIDGKDACINKLVWNELKHIRGFVGINFEQMKLDGVDGIYLTEKGQYETRFMIPHNKSLYGWDCESIIIFNEKCINNVKRG